MHFSAIASVTILGLSTFVSAQPLDRTLIKRQEPAKRPACGWIDNIIDRGCDDDDDASSQQTPGRPRPIVGTPNQAQQPRPMAGTGNPWAASPAGGAYNPLGQAQPRPQQQAGTPNPWAAIPAGGAYNPLGQAQPRPQQQAGTPNPWAAIPAGGAIGQGQAPRPQAGQNQQGGQWQEAQSSPYENANGGESWCNRPDPARRPTYCQGPAAAPTRPQGQQGNRGARGDRNGSG